VTTKSQDDHRFSGALTNTQSCCCGAGRGHEIYNDGYSVFAGGRHPALLGTKVRDAWPEVADFNDKVLRVGLAGGTLSYKDQEPPCTALHECQSRSG
jgi:hypothetical protein